MDPTDDRCNWVTQFFGRTPLMKVCAVLSSDGQYLIYKSPARLCTYTMVLHLNMFGPGMNNMTVIDGQAPLVMFQSQDRAVSQWFERDIWNGRFRTSPLLGHGRKSTDNVEGIFLSQHRYRQQLLETDGMTNFIQRGHADLVGDADTRQSTSAYCFLLGLGLTSWKSLKQNSVFNFSIEAEYQAYWIHVVKSYG